MTPYEVLLSDMRIIEEARETLPDNAHINALFDLTLGRLRAHADAMERRARGDDAMRLLSSDPQSEARYRAIAS
jgi:hypothetical protein